jgi:hypothetical protein
MYEAGPLRRVRVFVSKCECNVYGKERRQQNDRRNELDARQNLTEY